MPIPFHAPRRIALLGLLVAGLVMLADGAARVELARAVDASLKDSARMVVHIGAAED